MLLLDASALIAALYDEPGADTVAEHLDEAALLAVNLEEVAGKLLRDGMDVATAHRVVDRLGLETIAFTAEMAWRAASLRAVLPPGLGIADRACLAAASVLGVGVLTADGAWRDAAAACDVRVVNVR